MSLLSRRPVLRWVAPLSAVALLATGGSAVGVITAAAHSGLPHRSAATLLVDVQKARLDGLSGTIVQHAQLGLPSLPGVGGSGSSDMTSLVAGSHTLRLWYAGPQRMRLALLGSLGESDVVRTGNDLWTWSSPTRSATHRRVPAGPTGQPQDLASGAAVTPQQAADTALKAVSPSTRVHTDGTAVVAGRSAYELVLEPRDDGSLVDSVRIAVDGATHVPTRVQVFAKGLRRPALEVGFSSFDPGTPSPSVFRFNPPPGTKVTESAGSPLGAPTRHRATAGAPPARGSSVPTPPKVVGKGWASVVVAKVPPGALTRAGGLGNLGSASSVLARLPRVSGSWGSGRLLSGTLFSALLTDDGRLVVGAVTPAALYAALAPA
jgi:outer membrane lipoprotein-sorting protein